MDDLIHWLAIPSKRVHTPWDDECEIAQTENGGGRHYYIKRGIKFGLEGAKTRIADRKKGRRDLAGFFVAPSSPFSSPDIWMASVLTIMAASTSTRALWKGAISFGLVHIPVALHSATSEQGLDFDWLDKRTMDPVGYKRINKKTGKEIDKENIVKGIEYEDGHYVVLSQEEIAAAYPKATQTIEIEMFVPATDIPFVYLERPYYVAPTNKGGKVYALLREALLSTERIGIARVVIQTKQHLAALIPSGPALVLNLLRWGDEIRSWENLSFPAEGTKEVGITDKELKMAEQLVTDMSGKWNSEEFRDSFKDEIMKLVHEKVETGDIQTVAEPEESERTGAQILDLTELLKRSLKKDGEKEDRARTSGRKSAKTGTDDASSRTRGSQKRRAG